MSGIGFYDIVRGMVTGQNPATANALQPQITEEQAMAAFRQQMAQEAAAQPQALSPQAPQGYVEGYRQQYVDPRLDYMRKLQMAGQYGN